MFERFTGSARSVVRLANESARQLQHNYIGTEHLLLAMTRLPADDLAARALADHGVTTDVVEAGILRIIGQGRRAGGAELDADALRTLGIDLDAVRRAAEDAFGPDALDRPAVPRRRGRLFRRRPHREPARNGHRPFAPRAKKVFELALREALRLDHHYIGTEHLLLGLLREGQGVGVRIITEHGAEPSAIRAWLLDELRRSA